ncbi:WbuC family cupin fold metalloprotein [Klebsiella pneumoniae]|uniref:WbuC family cupin fold metalloprotein n=1 Tax=Klebsiella pneumoniae TaxID=573 RepID=UPI000E2ADC59|nr:WbuC family cupin fold metalloprotein [Klebsiella pneumoniae]SWY83209.1 Tryptophan synthase subunit beta like protein [Klebsiella pneumoniae]
MKVKVLSLLVPALLVAGAANAAEIYIELLLPLRGRFVVLNFDDRGTVTHRAILGETCTVLEMAAGTWHAVLSLDTGGIIFEVKHGGYQPVAADDYAHWAPAEGEPGTTELMAWYAQAQVGDSTFAV